MQAIRDAPLRYLGALLLLIAAYAISGRAGLELAHEQVNATLVWPPTGLALGALLLFGPRLWPGVLVGALLVNFSIGTAPGPAVGIAIGNTLEALAGYWLLRHVLPFDLGFRRPLDVVIFVGAAALLASLVSATIGVGSLLAFEVISSSIAGSTFLTWWLGDAGGAVVVAPVLILVARGTPDWRDLLHRSEAWFVLFLLFLTGVPAFFAPAPSHWAALFLSNLTIPVVAWAGLRLGHRGAAIAIIVVACLAAIGTSLDLGPFSVAPHPVPLLLLWAYLTSIAATALTLAATSAEREAAAQARLDDAERERELQRQVLELQRLESLGLMAGSVAHDFNNLLAGIMGSCGVLRASLQDPAQLEQIENVLVASRRAASLCSNLLSYSGRSVRQLAPISPQDLARPLPKLLVGVWPESVQLELDVQEELPPLRGDFAELTQVLMNLALNAGQAEGSSRVAVRVGLRRFDALALEAVVPPTKIEPGEHLYLEVEDDGSGLDEEVRSRLFAPFFTTKVSGRGLGLATALGIVSGHGGALLLETELGRGTRICVALPVAGPAASPSEVAGEPGAPEPVPPAEEAPAAEAPSTSSPDEAPLPTETESSQPAEPPLELPAPAAAPLRLLLADDAAPILNVTRLFLRDLGYEVTAASDGQQALEAFQASEAPFDLAIIDVTMPKLSGLELLPLLRRDQPSLPVVLMSGYSAEEFDPAELEVEFLSKPFEFDDLIEVVERLTSSPAP